MVMDFRIAGETLVVLKFADHISGTKLLELGLATESIRVFPRFSHQDVRADDFGPHIPADVMTLLADARISMTLIHYDDGVLNLAMAESFGRTMNPARTGTLAPAGSMMGNGLPLLVSGNHFMHLNLVNANPAAVIFGPQMTGWRFPAAYLTDHPVEVPVGTETSKVVLNWRAIPYRPLYTQAVLSGSDNVIGLVSQEILSSGAVLWDFNVDEE